MARDGTSVRRAQAEGNVSLLPKLFLLSHGFQTEYEAGFANGASRVGLDVTVIASDNTLLDRMDSGVRTLNLRGSQNSRRSSLAKAANILRYVAAYTKLGISNRDAIFHFCGLFTLRRGIGVLVEALWSRLAFRTWWLTVHNLLPHDDHSAYTALIFRLTYRLPDRLIVHTPKIRQQLIESFGISPSKITVIEHGIDRFIHPIPDCHTRITKAFQLPAHDRLLLVFGNISPYKGVDILLEALRRTRLPAQTVLLIAGKPSSPSLRTSLQVDVQCHPQSSRIHLHLDYVDEDLVAPLLSAADAMILPYRHIDQSGVLFAAKSAGLPCILTDVGSFADYIDQHTDILVPPADPEALSKAIEEICQRPAAIDRSNSIRAAMDRFSWSHTLAPYARAARAIHESAPS